MKSLLILKHVSITEDNDWSGFMSSLPLPIEQTLLLLIDYGYITTNFNIFIFKHFTILIFYVLISNCKSVLVEKIEVKEVGELSCHQVAEWCAQW